MVVLDAVHDIQAHQANDLACRWNCKAGKCGSCSAEVNGMPKLMCMTRLSDLPLDRPITIEPMKAFPRVKDLITDVSWNFAVKKRIKKFKPRPPDAQTGPGGWLRRTSIGAGIPEMYRVLPLPGRMPRAARSSQARSIHRPAFSRLRPRRLRCTRSTPRIGSTELREAQGIGFCNITKCCTKVCPEDIQITDNAIIPLKERVVDDYYDPLGWLWKKIRQKNERAPSRRCLTNMPQFKSLSRQAIPAALEKGGALSPPQ
jgi:succinate dehydrogenase / fumarate reductase iron-sulfur subunit